MRRLQEEIFQREMEISTGLRVRRPSQDPLAAVRAMDHQAAQERADQYLRNITLISGEMASIDGALSDLNDIAVRAREILLSQVSDTAMSETRRNSAIEVQELLEGALAIANRKFAGRYLFGGNDALSQPVEMVGVYAAFNPAARGLPEVNIGLGESIRRGVSGAEAFGALSAEIRGRADLNPRVTADTKLSDLNGGLGVRSGSIRIENGLGDTATVDLSTAETVGDVMDLINDTGIVTASVNGAENGLALAAAGGNLTVEEVEEGSTALDLGILASGAGAALTGSDIDPRIRLTTPLADLLGGAGIDPSGFTIENGEFSVSVSPAGMTTVEDLLNAVNGSGAHILASLNGDGTGIDIRSTLSGARLSVVEGSGTTAADLGLVISLADTTLERLNGGLGVGQVAGNDFRIRDKTGATFDIDIAGAATVQDVIDLINNSPDNPGTILASLVSGQDRIRIDDSSGGTENLRVESLSGSFTAENLGIAGEVADPGTILTGEDLQPAGVQVDSLFNALILLRDALAADDQAQLNLIIPKLESATNRLLDARAEAGSRYQRLERSQGMLEDEKVELQTLITEERGADLAEAVTEFQRHQTILQATYAVTAEILSMSLMDFLR